MQEDEVEVISEITDIEIIAIGSSIRELDRLQKKHGRGRWRKLKGMATVRRYRLHRRNPLVRSAWNWEA